jgi:hypothetical protein
VKPLVLYSKSFSTDLRRLVRLAQSIRRFNSDDIPFYVSVPQAELQLFQEHLTGLNVELLADEDILRASPRIDIAQVAAMPGGISQQVIKSEFWRLGLSDAYLCLDSDSIFIRPFGTNDYLADNGTPYSVISEAHDLLNLALEQSKYQIIANFQKEAAQVQAFFSRTGKAYSFGPMPLVRHRAVWESLDQNYFQPRGMSFAHAIAMAPLESRWYGEAHLKYQAIPLVPTEQFFKVYHYAWQLDKDLRNGLGVEALAQLYSGVIYQSSWDRELDWPREGGNWLSRQGRRMRRYLERT